MKIDPNSELSQIHTIKTSAKVSVSDGLKYEANTLFHDHQRAIFQTNYPERKVTHGLEGKYVWTYEGDAEKESNASIGNVVLGHQLHAQLLYFEKL